jgi:hypothetical protein
MGLESENIISQLLHIAKVFFRIEDCGKVIFLDFDGVLATEDYTESLLITGQKTKDKFGTLFTPNCIEQLNWIINQTNAKIIITSSWKNYLSLWDFIRMWRYRKISGMIIGVTPSVSIYRGEEIDQWLCNHKGIINYVIIDDMDYKQFREEQYSHLITTNHFLGLNRDTAERAIALLNK